MGLLSIIKKLSIHHHTFSLEQFLLLLMMLNIIQPRFLFHSIISIFFIQIIFVTRLTVHLSQPPALSGAQSLHLKCLPIGRRKLIKPQTIVLKLAC